MCQIFIFGYYVTEILSQLTNWETFSCFIFSPKQYVAWPLEILVGET